MYKRSRERVDLYSSINNHGLMSWRKPVRNKAEIRFKWEHGQSHQHLLQTPYIDPSSMCSSAHSRFQNVLLRLAWWIRLIRRKWPTSNLETMSSSIEQWNAGLTSSTSSFLVSDGGYSQGRAVKHLAKFKFSAGSSSDGFVATSLWCCVQCLTRSGTGAGRFLCISWEEITLLTFFLDL